MKILTKWLRAYLPGLAVDDAQLAEDLTLRGIAVEGIYPLGEGNGSLYEMDITTNRVDAMNHYGIAREAAAIYGLTLRGVRFRAARGAAGEDAVLREDRSGRCVRAVHGARAARCDDRRVARLVRGRGGCDVFRAARAEDDFECRGRDELCLAGDGAADARLRSGQDRGRNRCAAGAQGRAAEDAGRRRARAGCGRSGGGRSQEGAGAGRRDGRLGHDDYAGDEERAGRGGVVRSGGSSANGAAARTAHRREPPVRARRGLQRGAGCVGAGERDSAGQRRMDRRRAGGCARGGAWKSARRSAGRSSSR